MKDQGLIRLLKDLGRRGIEKARPELAQQIKGCIPDRLTAHRLDTINIVVDLRISRLAAAAVIVITFVMLGVIFGLRDTGGMLRDGKTFLNYCLGGEQACQSDILASDLPRLREYLVSQGKEVVYYGDKAAIGDRYAVVMYWRLPDDRYGVIFGDMTTGTINSRTLIRLQSRMLKERTQ